MTEETKPEDPKPAEAKPKKVKVVPVKVPPPDFRKSLPQLRAEWEGCSRCALGERRINEEKAFVFGERVPYLAGEGSILFVGEGPGLEEEQEGRPFVGKTGRFLRKVLMMLGLESYYLTNAVACRSCSLLLDAQQVPVMRKNWQTKQQEFVYRDEPPTPPQFSECLPRLHEEIYLVDPVVIVGMGNSACQALMQHNVTITRDRGEGSHILIPGASHRMLISSKKEWQRKLKGQWVYPPPTEQNMVRYHFVPTLHPSFVMRKIADQQERDSPFRQFVRDIKKAIITYEEHERLRFGEAPVHRVDLDEDEMRAQFSDEE